MTTRPLHTAIALRFALAFTTPVSSLDARIPTILSGPQPGPADRIALDYLQRASACTH